MQERVRTCTRCKVEQDIEEFSPTIRNEDGSIKYRSSWCKACKRETQRGKSGARKPIPVVLEDRKECLECHEIKHVNEFSKSSRGRLGRAAYCKPCASLRVTRTPGWREKNRERTRKFREENKEVWRARHRINQFNRRRKIKATEDGTVTPVFVEFIYRLVICHWCGKMTEPEERTLEHVVELSQGGAHSRSNIVMACFSCNSARKGRNGQRLRTDDSRGQVRNQSDVGAPQ